MDEIRIKNLRAHGLLGINPDERITPQEIIVNVIMYADLRPAADSHNIEDAVNYAEVSEMIRQHIEGGDTLLVETLVTDIARLILLNQPLVEQVQVTVEKPQAIDFVETVGAQIMRRRSDFNIENKT